MEGISAKIAIDAVLFSIIDSKIQVYLVKRENEPFQNHYELLGRLLREEETAEKALQRRLSETFNRNIPFIQFGSFTSVQRDPRERVISISYVSLVRPDLIEDTSHWFALNKLPPLAFDHKEIVNSAKKYVKQHLIDFVKESVPEKFPLNALQQVYELFEETIYDNRNFRKKILSSNLVEDTKELETNVSHRPAKLFRFL